MKSHYDTLGVNRDAAPEDIKKAYRKLASLYHPDKEGGSKIKFQEVEEAYRTLSDPQKRQQYDNPNPFGGQGFGPQAGGFDFQTIFDIFGTRFQHGGHPQQPRQQQARMTLWITLQDVAQGGNKQVSVGTHQGTSTIEIEIPLGIDDGDTVHYSKIGPGGIDLLITYRIHPNPKWQRNGTNLIVNQDISVWDLITGNEITIKDILGNTLSLTIPPMTEPGTMFRLRGRGLAQRQGGSGDLIVRAQAQLPKTIDSELLALIEKNKSQ